MTILDRYSQFIQTADQEPEHMYFPSSLLSVNQIIGDRRGIRSGRIVQFVGNPGTGKSTLSLDLIKNAQPFTKCAYVDFERTFDKTYSAKLGVDLATLALVKADTAETGLQIVEAMIQEAEYKLIIIDSIPAAVPSEEHDKEMTDTAKMAVAAGLWTRFLRRIIPLADANEALIVLLNQFRANISTLARIEQKPYGAKMVQYVSSLTIELSRIKNEDLRTTVRAKVTKNKLGTEHGIADFDIIYDKGPDITGDIIKHAIDAGIVTKSGKNWYEWNGVKANGIGQLDKFDIALIRKELEEKHFIV